MELHRRFTISLLPNRVSVYTLSALETSAFHLIQTLLYSEDKFISFTVSDREISLITDADMGGSDSDSERKRVWCMKDPSVFRIFEFQEGGSGINHCGIVQTLSEIFSKAGIEILYINTFNKNFILVKEEKLKDCEKLIGLGL